MLYHILESGAINATFWFVLACTLALLLSRRGNRLIRSVVVFALVFGTADNLFLAIYRGYTVPRDVMQDVVSAQEYLAGRPLYPPDMTQRINDALAREGPRRSLLERWPSLHQREQEHINDMLTSHWVQAHPPFMTLFTAAFVKPLGILGTQIAFAILGFLALFTTLYLIRIELFPQVSRGWVALAAIAIVGWDPLLTVIRAGQTGILLGGLLTLSWFLLRRDRPTWAGVAAGVAISLKLIPAVILLVFVIRHRRAALSAAATVVAIGLFVLGMTSVQDHIDYVKTSRGVAEMYAPYSGNLSLMGALARGLRSLDGQYATAQALWFVCGVAIAIGFALLLRKQPSPDQRDGGIDLEFGLAMSLIPLLSPVAWDHYFAYLILPIAVLGSRVISSECRYTQLAFAGLLLVLAIPDSAYHWLLALCSDVGMHGFGIWFVLNVRLAAMFCLTGWLGLEMRRASQTQVIKSHEDQLLVMTPGTNQNVTEDTQKTLRREILRVD